MKARRILRLVLLAALGGCDGGAAFQSCWVPQLSFSSGDAGSQPRTTSAYVTVAPRAETAKTSDDTTAAPVPDEPEPESSPQGSYYRIPALPQPSLSQAPPSAASTYGGGTVYPAAPPSGGLTSPPSASATSTPNQTPSAEAADETPQYSEAPAPGEMVVLPVYPESRRAAETPGLVMPGVRPPAGAGEQSPESQPRTEQLPPATAATPQAPHVAPGPVNFRVPAPPPAPVIP